MANSRLDLQNKLEEILGATNVYYDPPANITRKYPAIIYTKSAMDIKYANNKAYMMTRCYQLTVVDKLPDCKAILKLLDVPRCGYDRHYISDGLHHDVLKLYF